MVCSTPEAVSLGVLGPDALSPDAFDPDALSPHTPSAVKRALYSEKVLSKPGPPC